MVMNRISFLRHTGSSSFFLWHDRNHPPVAADADADAAEKFLNFFVSYCLPSVAGVERRYYYSRYTFTSTSTSYKSPVE